MNSDTCLIVENLRKIYSVGGGFMKSMLFGASMKVHAVGGVSFEIKRQETFGLAGESGSGKTTIARLVTRLEEPTEGKILFNGLDIAYLKGHQLAEFKRNIQMIFQDPYDSLDPRFTVYNTICEPLRVHRLGSKSERLEMVRRMLERVELRPPEDFLNKYPHQLSGGERQRVAISRALITHPEFIVADEPFSMLDVSIRSEIMNLMLQLKEEMRLASLFITHDLSVARYMVDRLAIMYLGKIVEIGPTEKVVKSPLHPYTKLLLASVPIPDPTYNRQRLTISLLALEDAARRLKGCRYSPRCTVVNGICKEKEPELKEISNGRYVACHNVGQ